VIRARSDRASCKDRITIVAAGRLHTIMHADRTFVIEDGVVAESSAHDELLRKVTVKQLSSGFNCVNRVRKKALLYEPGLLSLCHEQEVMIALVICFATNRSFSFSAIYLIAIWS
jgi:hypothetical protein